MTLVILWWFWNMRFWYINSPNLITLHVFEPFFFINEEICSFKNFNNENCHSESIKEKYVYLNIQAQKKNLSFEPYMNGSFRSVSFGLNWFCFLLVAYFYYIYEIQLSFRSIWSIKMSYFFFLILLSAHIQLRKHAIFANKVNADHNISTQYFFIF